MDMPDAVPGKEGCCVCCRQGHTPKDSSFHTHGYYEVSLILSGDVTALLRDRKDSGLHPRLLLAAPGTPHLTFLESASFTAV